MTNGTDSGFLRPALRRLRRRWQIIAGAEYDVEAASLSPDLPDEDAARVLRQMHACLEAHGGEVSARARAAALGRAYLALDDTGRQRFLRALASEFDVDDAAVATAVAALGDTDDAGDRAVARRRLREALVAPRLKLLTRFNSLPEGVKFLVDLRAELLPLTRQEPILKALDDDLRGLLATWFDVDFLELRQITWESASGALLERLIAYEAVHPIESWDDLKNRLDYDRRYFAFFHPRMPDEPLIFVEVALVDGMAGNVQTLLDAQAPLQDPSTANAAIFYSINNAQRGLDGISFGNFLIKKMVDRLTHEFPGIKTFATLSPIPGFSRWLTRALSEGEKGLLLPAERKALSRAGGVRKGIKGWLKEALADGIWAGDEAQAKALRPVLMRLAARYLMQEKRDGRAARDPVAHFHLSNGARMERLNWMADPSDRGLRQSAGMMINYLYDLGRIDANHEAYRAGGRITASAAMRTVLKG